MNANHGLECNALLSLLLVPALLQSSSATSTTEITTSSTTTVPEFSYYVGDWSDCSATCEIGSRQREVFCYRTCSTPRACTSDVTDWHCLGTAKPSETDYCFGAAPVCPATSTDTKSTTLTRTLTTSTATEVTETSTRGVVDGWECVPGATNCVIEQVAATQCGSFCSCCRRSTTQVPFIPSRTTTPRPETEDSSGVLVAVLVGLVITAACVVVTFAVIGWRYYVRKPQSKQKPRPHSSQSRQAHGVQAETVGAAARPTSSDRHRSDEAPEKTVFDRKLGRGVPSAAPDGYFEGPPEWMNDEEAGVSSKTASPRSAFSRAFSHSAFETEKNESAKSSPSRRKRQEPQEPDSRENRKPESERPSPNAPSGTLPPGYASAARRNRRVGKDPPDIGSSNSAEPGETETNIPGQANTDDGPTKKSTSKTGGAKGSSASAPSQEPKTDQAPNGGGDGNKRDKESPRGAGNASRSKSGTGARDSSANPRVAADTAAAPEASDLIAKVDHELDQSQCKDLETRRRVFKNLILKWHPDKNQEEALAAEVFRHLMARRGRFLEA